MCTDTMAALISDGDTYLVRFYPLPECNTFNERPCSFWDALCLYYPLNIRVRSYK